MDLLYKTLIANLLKICVYVACAVIAVGCDGRDTKETGVRSKPALEMPNSSLILDRYTTTSSDLTALGHPKYSYLWYLNCRDVPEDPACAIEDFKSNPNSFTSILGLQDAPKPEEDDYSYLKLNKTVPPKNISLVVGGELPNNEYCRDMAAAISKDTKDLIHVASSSNLNQINHIDDYFLPYLETNKLREILGANFLHTPIPWKAVPETDRASIEAEFYFKTSPRLENDASTHYLYNVFESYSFPNTPYAYYRNQFQNPFDTNYGGTIYGQMGSMEEYAYYMSGALFEGKDKQPGYAGYSAVLDFVDDNGGVYFLNMPAPIDLRAPDRLALLKLFQIDPLAPGSFAKPQCEIEFVFNLKP